MLNADDPRVARFRDVHPGRTVTFGFGEGADVRAEQRGTDRAGRALPGGRRRVSRARWPAATALLNLLAGIAVAGLFGIRPRELAEVVTELHLGHMRGERFCTTAS